MEGKMIEIKVNDRVFVKKTRVDYYVKEIHEQGIFLKGYVGRVFQPDELEICNFVKKIGVDKLKKPLSIVLDYVERWNKQDKEKEVAEAVSQLEELIDK